MNKMKPKRTTIFLLAITLLLCPAGCKNKGKDNRLDMDALKAAEVGSYIYFGEYEQDNNESTGKEAIEWLVLDKQEDRMLVVSRYGLDCQPYNTELKEVTWETCSLHDWLNSEFFKEAFNSEEKDAILLSTVTDDANQAYDTADRVFLLSTWEAEIYFADNAARTCSSTPYCYAQGAPRKDPMKIEGSDTCMWWLRSPASFYDDCAAGVSPKGFVGGNGLGIMYDCDYCAVRPAMWIDLKH